jgi:hypothetical protein
MLAALLTNLTGFTWNCVAVALPAFSEVSSLDAAWPEEIVAEATWAAAATDAPSFVEVVVVDVAWPEEITGDSSVSCSTI